MALLKTRDDILYECVKLSTYCIFLSLKYLPAAQTTFTNNRCSNKKKKTAVKTEIDHVCFYVFLPLFFHHGVLLSPPPRQWHHWDQMVIEGCHLSQKKTLSSMSLCTPQGQERESVCERIEMDHAGLSVEFISV